MGVAYAEHDETGTERVVHCFAQTSAFGYDCFLDAGGYSFVDVGLVIHLTAGSSALMSTMAVGIMMGLDGEFIFAAMVVSTVLLPVSLPITALILIGIDLEIEVLDLMVRRTFFIGSAIVVALLLRWLIGKQRIKKGGVALDGYTVLLLWLFAIPLMDGIKAR